MPDVTAANATTANPTPPNPDAATPELMKAISAAFNSRDVDRIYTFRGGKISAKDTYWKIVENKDRF